MIDLLFRITCVPGKDRVLICPPTYGMYAVCAKINDVGVVRVNLDVEGGKFAAQVDQVCLPSHSHALSLWLIIRNDTKINATLTAASKTDSPIKLLFLCSPGNPTGTLLDLDSIRSILFNPDYTGLVVVDEAYIDFADEGKSAVGLLVKEGWSNLVVMQTLSKGFGLAAIRYAYSLCMSMED